MIYSKALGQEATELVLQYGGTVSGEHGDGRIRAGMVHAMYGPQLVEAFQKIKAIFDPKGLLNPGNLISDPGMTTSLRLDAAVEHSPEVDTWFKWTPSLLGAAEACNGNGYCRSMQGGVMCPSYRATQDERHATRGRGNALRLAISGQLSEGGVDWGDADTHATLDLCLGCKACRYECPAAVDMSKLKAEFQAQAMDAGGGPSVRTRVKGAVRLINRIGSTLHPLSTWLAQHGPSAWLLKRAMGIAPSRTLPGFSRSLIRWHRRRRAVQPTSPVVLLYPDCFTTWSESAIGQDAIRLLEAFGYRVVIPDVGCCGRTQVSSGMLAEAVQTVAQSATSLLKAMEEYQPVAIVGVEPSCVTALQQEWQELKTGMDAGLMQQIAQRTDSVEGFLASAWEQHPTRPLFTIQAEPLPIHQHCHQKPNGKVTERFLNKCGWPSARLVDSGCCGMAGAFGYDARYEGLSRAVCRQSLAAVVSHDGPVAAGGSSCRHQIEDELDLTVLHPVTMAARALEG